MLVRNDGGDTARGLVIAVVADTGVAQLRSAVPTGVGGGRHLGTWASELVESADLPTTDGLLGQMPWFLPGEA
jgi:hypothetical protein